MEIYRKKCTGAVKKGIRQGLISGAGFGLSLALFYFAYATAFYAGARLVEAGKTTFADVFRASSARCKLVFRVYLLVKMFRVCAGFLRYNHSGCGGVPIEHVCARLQQGQERNCFHIWHSRQKINH